MSLSRSLAVAAALVVVASSAAAQDTTAQRGVRIGLTYALGTRPGIMVLPVTGATGDSIQTILQRDLDYGDRVTVVPGEAAAAMLRAGGRLNYELLGKLGAAGVVQATPTATGLRVAVHDVAQQRVAHTADFTLPGGAGGRGRGWRFAVHGIADEIERWITGTRGIAQTRIAFVRDGRLWAVDSDGANEEPLTPAGSSPLSPAWHRTGRYVAFSELGSAGSRIVVRDLQADRSRPLVATPGGLNITPVFSPDGDRVVYAHGLEAGTDLVTAAAFGDGPGRRLTVGRGSDNVSPTFSPDGRRIAFTSGRSGHPEVYVMDADGTNVELLTPFAFGDQYYRSNPDWSPDGRTVAFQSQIDGRFQVMVITLRDRSIRQLTSEGANEDPSFAPDGRHLVFTTNRTGVRQLFVLDVESGRARQLTRAGGGRMAAWSPRLASAVAAR